MTRAAPARSPAKVRKKPGGAQPKRPRGRPPKYRPEFAERVTDLCLLGATNEELAKVFGVDDATISRWLDKTPEFRSAVKQGRELADMKVARALYLKATGQWTRPAVKIATRIEILPNGTEIKSEHIVPYVEHFPPDTAAAFIWLKNRQPHRWRDKKEVHETGDHTSQQRVAFELSPRPRPTSMRSEGCWDRITMRSRQQPRVAPPAMRPMARGRAMATRRTDNGGGDIPRLLLHPGGGPFLAPAAHRLA